MLKLLANLRSQNHIVANINTSATLRANVEQSVDTLQIVIYSVKVNEGRGGRIFVMTGRGRGVWPMESSKARGWKR